MGFDTIGILISGVITSKYLIAKSRLASAQSLTTSSPITSITDNNLWLEILLEGEGAEDGRK